jgi:hypothetical protein
MHIVPAKKNERGLKPHPDLNESLGYVAGLINLIEKKQKIDLIFLLCRIPLYP